MGENRVKQFRDKTMSCIRGRRGSNQKEELYPGEYVPPYNLVLILKIAKKQEYIWVKLLPKASVLIITF